MRVFCFSVSLSAVGVVGTSDFGHSYIYVVESHFNLSFIDDVSCGASFLFFFSFNDSRLYNSIKYFYFNLQIYWLFNSLFEN